MKNRKNDYSQKNLSFIDYFLNTKQFEFLISW